MSFPSKTWKAMPTVLRVGLSEAIAYRAEMLVWVLATTMPLVMWLLWSSVAEQGAMVGNSGRRFGSQEFTGYFLAVFVTRQLISAWASWEINFEVRQGTLSMRLLRPIHPLLSFAAGNVAAMPLRFLVSLPAVFLMVASGSHRQWPEGLAGWSFWLLSLALAWGINFFANVLIGSMCFFLESSLKLMDLWLASFMVFSGYLFPLELFPPWLQSAADWLPFRFQVAVPVEMLTRQPSMERALSLLGMQACWAFGLWAAALTAWSKGMRRFASVGG